MKKLILNTLNISLVVSLCSCSSVSTVTPIVNNEDGTEIKSGIVFSLPKTLVKVDITYSLYTKRVWEANSDGTPKKVDAQGNSITPKTEAKVVYVDTPVAVSTFEIPDEDMRFIFSTSSMDSKFKEKDFKLVLSKEGIVKSFNSEVTDKSAEVVGSVSGIAFNLAKLPAVAGVDVVELTKDKDLRVSRILDLDSLKFSEFENRYIAKYNDLDAISEVEATYAWPEVEFYFESDFDAATRLNLTANDILYDGIKVDESHPIQGIPYRSQGIISLVVKINGAEVLEKPLSISHAGPLAFIPVNSGAFESTTHALEFYDNTGQLSKFQSKGGASAPKLAGALQTVSENALSTAKELNTLKIQAEIDKLKKKKELLDARESFEGTELSKLQDEIDLLKKEQELVDVQDSQGALKVKELQKQIDILTKEKQLADLQKSVNGTEISNLQEQINLLGKKKELLSEQQSLNQLDTGSASSQVFQLEQKKQLLDKQREIKRAEIEDMNLEIEKLQKEAQLIDARKRITDILSEN